MPWSIVHNHGDCPDSQPWAVVKDDDDGAVEGCHATEGDAKQQLAALNAQENAAQPAGDVRERTASFTVTRQADGDGLSLEGYAAVFNQPTRIHDLFGEFDEVIAPGAFRRTIGQKGASGIRLQFDHGHHPLIGSIPLGSIDELQEDSRGLHVRASLTDNWLVQPVRDAIRDGAVDGMSFRFRVVREETDESVEPELRTVKEVELFELGPVVWPAYEQTTVGVRSRELVAALMDPEQRREVAQALLVGTSAGRAHEGTPAGPAADDDPPPVGTRRGPDPSDVLRGVTIWEASRR